MKFIDIEESDFEFAEEARVDWDVVTIPEVEEAIEAAARGFAHDYEGVVEFEDMQQELLVAAAMRPAMIREALGMENSRTVLITRLKRVLSNKFRRKATNLRKHRSYEGEQEKFNPEVA
ncbi:hypothetical protein SEA_BRATAYLOR_47 [Streptomyces phage Brataylor]|uniref:Uncharacterized protein n=1 Tax=Streptomyces phage Brataylor TaxID=1873994 RepID=A0A1C9LWY3_9CAUD|nr:hypothetical protein SEA_BRATAYLOR_47 [Streptomyces phage Brataylor]